MRASVIAVAAILLTVTGVEARGQEIVLPLGIDSMTRSETDQSRTPAMVVHELVATKPGAKVNPNAPKPIVVPASTGTVVSIPNTTGKANIDKLVLESASRNGVDPALLFAVMRQESSFNTRAMSYKGARGLMQLMPDTARRFGVSNIWDPAQNIEGGTRYLRFLLDTFNGDVKLALAGYNAGENAVIGSGYRVPRYRETQAYVRNISARYGSDKHGKAQKKVDPSAPNVMTISAGAGSRFSNNY